MTHRDPSVLQVDAVSVDIGERNSVGGGGGYHLPFTGEGHIPSVAAAVRAVAHPAPAVVAPVRAPLPSIDGWDLRSIPSSTGGGARCYRCVVPQCDFFLGPQAGQQSAPHMHVLVCICSNVRQFH